ncbi:hypothetical protein CDL12_15466 [Handroanthus impetiginosus]|uniref:Uncharacterized protein n=1 Tax=Handroanthus impetiginosus TaxID=429701 RepID=A0A2G9H341_9LAMI|nr:hypothetical protein CDL12_15466 [Handroanthus impetiginosus]
MAGNTKKVKDTNWHWTNERHLHFLNSMEASFVRTLFETKHRCLPLDRYIPDTSDSTEDLGKDGRRRRYDRVQWAEEGQENQNIIPYLFTRSGLRHSDLF